MNIQSMQNNYSYNNVSMCGASGGGKNSIWRRFLQKTLDAFPERTVKEGEGTLNRMQKIDQFVSKPANNRAIMMLTGIVPQVGIDYLTVNDETKDVSMIRTGAKCIIGGLVGIVVRTLTSWFIDKTTNVHSKSRFGRLLLPKDKANLKELERNGCYFKNYKNIISMGLALAVMLYTNFKCDAPWTAKATNWGIALKERLNPSKKTDSEHKEALYV